MLMEPGLSNCDTVHKQLMHQGLINRRDATGSIKRQLTASWKHSLSNAFIVFHSLGLFVSILFINGGISIIHLYDNIVKLTFNEELTIDPIKILEQMYQRRQGSKQMTGHTAKLDKYVSMGVFCILVVSFAMSIIYKMRIYKHDEIAGVKMYYACLIYMYTCLSKNDVKVYNKNISNINNIYCVLPLYLKRYINQTIIMNKSSILFNVLEIVLTLYITITILGAVSIAVTLVFGHFRNIDILNYTYKLNADDKWEKDQHQPLESYANDDAKLKIKAAQLLEAGKIVYDKEDPPRALPSRLANPQDQSDYNAFASLCEKNIIPGIHMVANAEEKISISEMLTLRYYPSDRSLFAAFGGLIVILLISIVIFKNIKPKDNGDTIEFLNNIQFIMANYTTYVTYNLKDKHRKKVHAILSKSTQSLILMRVICAFLATCILVIIIYLILQRRRTIKIIVNLLCDLHCFMTNTFHGWVKMIAMLLFLTAVVLLLFFLTLSIIMRLQAIFDGTRMEVDNTLLAEYIDNAMQLLGEWSQMGNIITPKKFIYKGGIMFDKVSPYKHNQHPLTLEVPKNEVTMIYGHHTYDIESYIKMIKTHAEHIYFTNEDGDLTSISMLTDRQLYDSCIIVDEYPIITNRSLEQNIYLSQMPPLPFHIDTVNQSISLKNIYDIYGAYNNKNVHAVRNASGGEKQRISLARAVAAAIISRQHKAIILLGGLGGLDHANTHLFLTGIKKTAKKYNITVLIITNDYKYLEYADTCVYIDSNGELHIEKFDDMLIRIKKDQNTTDTTQKIEETKHKFNVIDKNKVPEPAASGNESTENINTVLAV